MIPFLTTVFLGCKNISCTICRSVAHSTMSCPQINSSIPPCPDRTPVISNSYIPGPAATNMDPDFRGKAAYFASNRQHCNNFNVSKCSHCRKHCQYFHICSFCSRVHACHVCSVMKSVSLKKKKNISRIFLGYLSNYFTIQPSARTWF